MVEVCIEPDRVIFLEHINQIVRYALRANDRRTGTDTYYLYVRYLSEPRYDAFQATVGYHQSIAARQQYVAYLRSTGYIVDCFADIIFRRRAIGLSGKTTTRAVAAIHRTHIGYKQQYTVGVTMREPRCRRVAVFVQRVEQVGCRMMCLGVSRYSLFTHRTVGIALVDKAQIIGSDSHS